MNASPFSIKDIIEQSIRETFEQVMNEKIDELECQYKERITLFAEEQKRIAKRHAEGMALEMLQMMDQAKISIEFKI